METENQETPEAETEETPETEAEGGEVQGSEDTPVERPSKKERRAERAAEHNARQEAAQLREELRREREGRTALEASVAEMRGYLQAKHQKENEGQDNDAKEISRLRREANQHLKLAGIAKTQEGVDAEMEAYHEKVQAAAVMAAERALAPKFEQAQRQQVRPDIVVSQAQLAQEFPWLTTDRHAYSLAASIESEMLQKGSPHTVATSRAAAAEAAKRLGIGGHQAPTQQQRSAYSGIPSREGDNGGVSKPTLSANNLQDWQKKLAEKAYPEKEAPEAHKAWTALMNRHFASQNGTR